MALLLVEVSRLADASFAMYLYHPRSFVDSLCDKRLLSVLQLQWFDSKAIYPAKDNQGKNALVQISPNFNQQGKYVVWAIEHLHQICC